MQAVARDSWPSVCSPSWARVGGRDDAHVPRPRARFGGRRPRRAGVLVPGEVAVQVCDDRAAAPLLEWAVNAATDEPNLALDHRDRELVRVAVDAGLVTDPTRARSSACTSRPPAPVATALRLRGPHRQVDANGRRALHPALTSSRLNVASGLRRSAARRRTCAQTGAAATVVTPGARAS